MPKKKIEETGLTRAADETVTSDETAGTTDSAKQPDMSEVDINDLLGTMDGDQEGGEDEDEVEGDIDLDRFEQNDSPDEPPINNDHDATDEPPPEKVKRVSRKKKAPEPEPEVLGAADKGVGEDAAGLTKEKVPPPARSTARKRTAAPILTIESKAEVESQENIEEAAWHEIRNAYRTHRILTGSLGGIEQTETGKTIAIVNYNDFRIVIPMKEMMINLTRNPSGAEYDDLILRQNKILGNMLGAEIDFIVKGIESKSRSVVASRKDAMFRKRQLFYMNTDSAGMHRVYDGRVVQARVIAVADKVIRIEAFGVECSIMARDLSWDWLGDAH